MTFNPGDLVIDRDDPDPDVGVVVTVREEHCTDWEVRGSGQTVADQNPDYPADDRVVVIGFRHQLVEEFDDWRDAATGNIMTITDSGIKHYAFPAGRLKPISEDEATQLDETEDAAPQADVASSSQTPVDDRSPDITLTPKTAIEVKDALRDDGLRALAQDDGSLVVRKRGEEYTITADGVIKGQGDFRHMVEESFNKAISELPHPTR